MRAHVWLRGQRKTAETLGVSRHTLWRFLERGHAGRAVPAAVLSSVGGSVRAIEAARLEIIIDLEGLRPDPALRSLRRGLEDALLLLCATPLATVEELSRFGRVPASTLRDRLKKLTERGLVDSVPHHLSVLGARLQHRYFPTEKGVTAAGAAMGRLRVRGGLRVRLAVYLKALACNIKRMVRVRLVEMEKAAQGLAETIPAVATP